MSRVLPCLRVCRNTEETSMKNSENKNEEPIIDRDMCDQEEKEKRALERVEKERFIDGLKRYPEKGVQVYIDGKVAGPFDWEKLTMLREDNRFYMGDFIQDESGLREIRFDMVYHGEIQSERDIYRTRGRRKPVRRDKREEKYEVSENGAEDEKENG